MGFDHLQHDAFGNLVATKPGTLGWQEPPDFLAGNARWSWKRNDHRLWLFFTSACAYSTKPACQRQSAER